MKKIIILFLLISFLLCGCYTPNLSSTYFYFDTAVTLTAECSSEVLDGAFLLCEKYENLLSRTKEGSDIYRINESDDFVAVNKETAYLIEKALYYSSLSNGKYDITLTPVSILYDFNNKILPAEDKIKTALEKVGCEQIAVNENSVSSGSAMLDLGSIAKGYIADKLCEYFKSNGVDNAVINLGGNVYVLGKNNNSVGIKKPFSNEVELYVKATNTSLVTSGIDQRYIEKDGYFYHHIIDKQTGYGVENSLASVTVIGESSTDCDALSTVCMLLGKEAGIELINRIDNIYAVFIEKDGTVTLSDGLSKKGKNVYIN